MEDKASKLVVLHQSIIELSSNCETHSTGCQACITPLRPHTAHCQHVSGMRMKEMGRRLGIACFHTLAHDLLALLLRRGGGFHGRQGIIQDQVDLTSEISGR
jgi:hypothetical protein